MLSVIRPDFEVVKEGRIEQSPHNHIVYQNHEFPPQDERGMPHIYVSNEHDLRFLAFNEQIKIILSRSILLMQEKLFESQD